MLCCSGARETEPLPRGVLIRGETSTLLSCPRRNAINPLPFLAILAPVFLPLSLRSPRRLALPLFVSVPLCVSLSLSPGG